MKIRIMTEKALENERMKTIAKYEEENWKRNRENDMERHIYDLERRVEELERRLGICNCNKAETTASYCPVRL